MKSVWSFVHKVLMVGSPGAGKTLLASAMPILPEMRVEESLDVTRIYSVGRPPVPNRPGQASSRRSEVLREDPGRAMFI